MHFSFFYEKNFQAILWILLCKFNFSLVMALARGNSFSSLQLNFMRSLFMMVISLFILLITGRARSLLEPFHQHRSLHFLRIALGTIAMVCFFYASQNLPLAKSTTLLFSSIFLTAIFASFFLKETISRARWFAIIVGYLGVWIAFNPSYDKFEWAEVAALITGICLAGFDIMAKLLITKTPPLVLVFYPVLCGVIIVGIYWLCFPLIHPYFPRLVPWQTMSLYDIGTFLIIAILALISQYAYLKANQKQDVSFLAPFDYMKFIFSVLLGIYCFDEWPAVTTWIGSALILLGAFYMHYQERQQRTS